MGEANVFDLEIGLLFLPFRRPGQMRFIELLPKLGDLERIGRRKENTERGGLPTIIHTLRRHVLEQSL